MSECFLYGQGGGAESSKPLHLVKTLTMIGSTKQTKTGSSGSTLFCTGFSSGQQVTATYKNIRAVRFDYKNDYVTSTIGAAIWIVNVGRYGLLKADSGSPYMSGLNWKDTTATTIDLYGNDDHTRSANAIGLQSFFSNNSYFIVSLTNDTLTIKAKSYLYDSDYSDYPGNLTLTAYVYAEE